MKLRYLRLQRSRPPLRDLTLTFPQDPLLSAQPLSFRFFVGLNGSGKTTLLQTLAEIFSTLDRDGFPPDFPLWLAYDLEVDGQTRTIYLYQPLQLPGTPSNTTLVIFDECLPPDVDWDELITVDPVKESRGETVTPSLPFRIRDIFTTVQIQREGTEQTEKSNLFKVSSWPGSSTLANFLPSAVLAYTSGDTQGWEPIFAPAQIVVDESAWSALVSEDERPANWDVAKENELRQRLGENQPFLTAASPETLAAQFISPSNSFLIDSQQLSLAATLVALKHLAEQGQDESLQNILNEIRVEWQAPLALSLWVNLEPVRLDPNRAVIIADLMKLATTIVSEPEPSQWRQLVFDPLSRIPEKDFNANPDPEVNPDTDAISYPGPQRIIFGDLTVNAILELLGGEGGEIFDVFRNLRDWQQNNLVRDVRLILRKNDVEDALLFDWLSDGERMLLGRIALFYLLRDKGEALLILDEPETHFNDAWKRRLVDMLDDALRDSAHQIIISTHSSILLSDVFNTEIIVLDMDGSIYEPAGGTFGTLPSEIMHNIFGADNPIGDRAKEFLDAVLTLVEYPDLVNSLWRALDKDFNPDPGAWLNEQHPFGSIIQIFNQREKEQKLPHRSPHQWLRLLVGLYRSTQSRSQDTVTLANVLEMLFDYVGAGYYQFELRRQHRRLTSTGENVTSS